MIPLSLTRLEGNKVEHSYCIIFNDIKYILYFLDESARAAGKSYRQQRKYLHHDMQWYG